MAAERADCRHLAVLPSRRSPYADRTESSLSSFPRSPPATPGRLAGRSGALSPRVESRRAENAVDKSHDGESACGNPLWLTLALEQLNLLDADDFALPSASLPVLPPNGWPLWLDTAARMPPEIGGLYGWLLEQNERAFGIAHARGFAMAIALSRSGWREADLIDLVPRLGKLLFPTRPCRSG